jgi:hypothetical protein
VHFQEVLPGLSPHNRAVKIHGYVRKRRDEYGLDHVPSLRVIRERDSATDIRAARSFPYASTVASTAASST